MKHDRKKGLSAIKLTDDEVDQLGQIRGGVRYEKGALVWSTSSGLDLEVSSRSRETLVSLSGDDRRHLAGAAVGSRTLARSVGPPVLSVVTVGPAQSRSDAGSSG